jgi:hypothetical protein
VIVPRLTLSATSKHYTALYNVITDLLLYKDPEHRQRSERIDSFTYAFDRKDRDPQRLFIDLFNLQQTIRSLQHLQTGYEANVDRLTEEGRGELFKIRTDLLEATEQLFTVFEAVAVNQARDDARAALKSAVRMDIRIGGIAWHMLKDDMTPLLKLDIDSLLGSLLSNKDGSLDLALAAGDLSGLNSSVDAVFHEVIVREDSSHGTKRKGVGRRITSRSELTRAAEQFCVRIRIYPSSGRRYQYHSTFRSKAAPRQVQSRREDWTSG